MLTHEQLNITEAQYRGLLLARRWLLSGPVHRMPGDPIVGDKFSMADWHRGEHCGSVCCIGGAAERLSGDEDLFSTTSRELYNLFYAVDCDSLLDDITPAQALRALNNYLETGQAKWSEIL